MSLDDRMRGAATRLEGATMSMEVPENDVARRARVRTITRTGVGVVALVVVTLLAVLMIGTRTSKNSDVADRGKSNAVGPYVPNQNDRNDPANRNSHWHAALGVWNCGVWMSDGTGNGVWQWPFATPTSPAPALPDRTTYAGLHSHQDGIIHMEPATAADAGKNATVGRYFVSGGWQVDERGFSFLGTTRRSPERCKGEPGTLSWWVNGKQMQGDPAKYKLYDNDTVVIAYLPQSQANEYPGNPPSVANLPSAQTREGSSTATAASPLRITDARGGALAFTPVTLNAVTGINELDVTFANPGHTFTFADSDLHFAELEGNTAGVTHKSYLFFRKAGDYEFFCTIPGHAAAGEKGVIHVTGPDATPPHSAD